MEPLWGTEIFPEYYSRFEKAARETEGVTLTWEGHFIDPLFTHTTTGFTVREMRNIPIWLPYPVSMILRRRDLCRK